MTPDARRLFRALEATWPAHAAHKLGPWLLREGRGGGKRVSAASAHAPATHADLAQAEGAMDSMGQPRCFMIRGGETGLDALLAQAGYEVIDPVTIYAAPLDALKMDTPAPTASFHLWEPLAIQHEIWHSGGIGPARIDVMYRAGGAKTALMGRRDGHVVATGFAAIDGATAMVHALEVLPGYRRQGVARALMLEAARWAIPLSAAHLAVACTATNSAATALYTSMGMRSACRYHYRQQPASGARA
ncbi:GNAT family N-acetyltransferase [Roseovarius dicentrarchi]|uniref:GNAT family N-acetyltransferase n=1 Tax=Roseovarius dicentrarchi TaxID=2250573 RepID=UPI000DE88D61|nr:GNAT family N-acetyltransferase [Roseovarius dicentrarchi]